MQVNATGPNHRQTTINCYTFFDKVFPECGLLDYTEGMYPVSYTHLTLPTILRV